jgi:lipid-binding SYLF domain-containing protein
MKTRMAWTLGCALTAAWLAGCGSTPNVGTPDERAALHNQCMATLTDMKNVDPSLQGRLDSSYGYAIFPEIINGAFGVGGAYGKGEVYQHGNLIGYSDLSQGNVGLQVGGQKYSELILFQNDRSLADFQGSTTEFDARATAVALASGSAAAADYTKGVLVLTRPESGLMLQAAIGGQKFRFMPANDLRQAGSWRSPEDQRKWEDQNRMNQTP